MAVSGGTLQKIAMDNLVLKQTLVTFQTSQGVDLHGTLIRSSKHQVVFEVYNCPTVLRLSEVLEGFKVGGGASALQWVMLVGASLYGSWIYDLQRAHVRRLLGRG